MSYYDINHAGIKVVGSRSLIVDFSFVALFGFILLTVIINNNALTFLIAFSLAVLFLFFVLIRKGSSLSKSVPVIVILTLFWIFASGIWGPNFLGTGLKALRASSVVLVVFLGVSIVGSERVMRHLPAMFFAMILAQIFAVILLSIGIHPETEVYVSGAWRGFLPHKNEAGALGGIAVIFFVRQLMCRVSIFSAFGFGLSTVFLLNTDSVTAVYSSALGVLALLCLANLKWSKFSPVLVFLLGLIPLALFSMLVIGTSFVYDLFDDPYEFTGRVALWRIAYSYWELHPFIGNGFRSVFGTPEVDFFAIAETPYSVLAPHPHNGYLDMLSGTGLIGFFLSLFAFLVLPILRALTVRVIEVSNPVPVCIAIILFSSARALFEASILQYDNMAWVLWLLALAILFRYSSDINQVENKK